MPRDKSEEADDPTYYPSRGLISTKGKKKTIAKHKGKGRAASPPPLAAARSAAAASSNATSEDGADSDHSDGREPNSKRFKSEKTGTSGAAAKVRADRKRDNGSKPGATVPATPTPIEATGATVGPTSLPAHKDSPSLSTLFRAGQPFRLGTCVGQLFTAWAAMEEENADLCSQVAVSAMSLHTREEEVEELKGRLVRAARRAVELEKDREEAISSLGRVVLERDRLKRMTPLAGDD